MSKLVIFGAGPFGLTMHYQFTRQASRVVAAFCVDGSYVKESSIQGVPVIASEEIEKACPPEEYEMFVALGIGRVNEARAEKVAEMESRGYRLTSHLSPKAHVWDGFVLQPNCVLMDGVQVHPYSQIGKNTGLAPDTIVSVFTNIGDNVWIVSATIGEGVAIGDNTFIGIRAIVNSGVTVGKSNIIGAGALIMKDTQDFEVYPGQASRPNGRSSQTYWR